MGSRGFYSPLPCAGPLFPVLLGCRFRPVICKGCLTVVSAFGQVLMRLLFPTSGPQVPDRLGRHRRSVEQKRYLVGDRQPGARLAVFFFVVSPFIPGFPSSLTLHPLDGRLPFGSDVHIPNWETSGSHSPSAALLRAFQSFTLCPPVLQMGPL